MADMFVHNNPRYPIEEIFARLEEKFVDMSHNMSLLKATLASNLISFREVGGSKSDIRLDGKFGDNEDPKKESWKEYKKERSSSNTIKPS
jgi:hypothetical protein